MTPREAVMLTGYLQAHFPSQPINEYTPDALGELLADYPAADCKAAVLTLAQRGSKWCAPSDVAAEVKRVRYKRVAEAGDLCPPPGLTQAEERQWLYDERKRIADGLEPTVVDFGELVHAPLPALRAVLKRPDDEPAEEATNEADEDEREDGAA